MTRRTLAMIAAAAAALGLAACGRALPTAAQLGGNSSGAGATAGLSPETTPPTRDYAKPVVWVTYRPVETLDPVQAFDYPENTVDTTLCDSLQRQQPDGSIGPGLATATYPTPTKLVLNLRTGPRFWDGHPVTAADVVWSLKRAASPTSGSFYSTVFSRVKSIAQTSPSTVTITLKQPDYWLQGELSSMPGIVVEKAFAEREGKKLGTPQGGIMCSGPYEVKKWIPGTSLTEVANPHYWDSTLIPKVHELIFKGIGDDASVTSGFETGAIQGSYVQNISTLPQLQRDRNLTVSIGPSNAVDALVICDLKGALKDVRVRRALSMAIDREGLIQVLYHGHAQLPRAMENPGAWGYGKSVFQRDWAKLPVPKVDLAKAKQLVKDAGAEGKSITIATTSSVNSLATAANTARQAAVSIGLKATIDSVSAPNYINLFTSASARKGIDMFPTTNYPDYADPAGLYNTFAIPGGSQNYDNFDDPPITKALETARSTANPDQRAALVARAGDLIMQQLPWIPLDAPDNILITSRQLTGAPDSFVYMGGPWANMMGGK
ncbi:MAG TPA: ABC transporter substrate-binding protein [Solirubrobacteraceae bacterium]|nr:ABC transporter substrate-binding protein [Solirubrobacteraceae bacterium]